MLIVGSGFRSKAPRFGAEGVFGGVLGGTLRNFRNFALMALFEVPICKYLILFTPKLPPRFGGFWGPRFCGAERGLRIEALNLKRFFAQNVLERSEELVMVAPSSPEVKIRKCTQALGQRIGHHVVLVLLHIMLAFAGDMKQKLVPPPSGRIHSGDAPHRDGKRNTVGPL